MKNSPFASVFATCFALVLSIGKACIGWSVVFYHHSNALLPYAHGYNSCGTS